MSRSNAIGHAPIGSVGVCLSILSRMDNNLTLSETSPGNSQPKGDSGHSTQCIVSALICNVRCDSPCQIQSTFFALGSHT